MTTERYNFFKTGELSEDLYYLHFPKLTNVQGRVWYIYLCIKNIDTDELVEINLDIIWDNPPENCYVAYITEYGLYNLNGTTTNIIDGKNTNKKNQTTYFTQAISDIYSIYNKKRKSSYFDYKIDIDNIKTVEDIMKLRGKPYVHPQNLHWFKDYSHKVTYPGILQPKLDGVMCIIIKHNNIIYSYSRQFVEYKDSVDNIKNELNYIPEDVFLVGELYSHGLSLQIISGISRKNELNEVLEFHIFDKFELKNETALERNNWIKSNIKESKYIKIIPSIIINNYNELLEYKNKFIAENYEGIVYKEIDSIHEYNPFTAKRSSHALKDKILFDDEFPIVSYNRDKNGGVIFICAQSEKLNSSQLKDRYSFHVVPNWTTADSVLVLSLLEDKGIKKLYGYLIHIVYTNISDYNIPQQPKCITKSSEIIKILNS